MRSALFFVLCFGLWSLVFGLRSLVFVFALCSLLFALCSLLFALCSLLFALCSLLFALCSLLFALTLKAFTCRLPANPSDNLTASRLIERRAGVDAAEACGRYALRVARLRLERVGCRRVVHSRP